MTTQNPSSIRKSEARAAAEAKLADEGWAWVQELAMFVHTDGRRVALVFEPDPTAPIVNGSIEWVRAVQVQAPSTPAPTGGFFDRTPTVTPREDVIRFW